MGQIRDNTHASGVLADCEQVAVPETETETETKSNVNKMGLDWEKALLQGERGVGVAPIKPDRMRLVIGCG